MKDLTLIQKSSNFANFAHYSQTRRGGEPYFNHVSRVAELVQSLTSDEEMIAAAYLHDTLEDCADVTPTQLKRLFGTRVVSFVQELTNDEALKHQLGKEEYMVRKLSSISADALLIKLCDTLNNTTETDSHKQALTYAKIQQRLQLSPPANWFPTHQKLSDNILSTYIAKFGSLD